MEHIAHTERVIKFMIPYQTLIEGKIIGIRVESVVDIEKYQVIDTHFETTDPALLTSRDFQLINQEIKDKLYELGTDATFERDSYYHYTYRNYLGA